MFVVVDDKIPYIRETIEKIADRVLYLPGKEFTKDKIKNADALIIRTRTRCNRQLLEDTNVKFIASATMGYDHIDTEYCKQAGITWTNCPGCNASSVGQYDKTVLIRLAMAKKLVPEETTVGIVGVGNAGSAVARAIRPLGVKLMFNDPPREKKYKVLLENEQADFSANPAQHEILPAPLFPVKQWHTLDKLAEKCDLIAFHVPLIYKGEYPTHYLANSTFFKKLKRHPVILNAGRGGVIDESALLTALDNGTVKEAVIDTWENEPDINRQLLEKTFIGTPHIAGYSADGKTNATRMSLEALCNFFGISRQIIIIPPEMSPSDYWNKTQKELQLYDPEADSQRLKRYPDKFEYLRGNYPLRRERRDEK